ncbi:DUF2628 domain-containing protein [Acuticoccus mangrovi]|uniref:DUF2628 domain-containing protein n=1 Tax=Acuticoccus mangrovi TaxID=2796142 RepID=A0A934IJN7_9HYPH|nr:DUF2628 domain-containing protein [Acuticoccus mangrovi]MBJ3777723.1 DUF2628 domain-containing protein [Acuticoccus mangrovi]
MAIWTVWEHEKFGEKQAERAVFVRDGFAWLAMIAPPLWLLANHMWVLFVVLGVLVGAILWLVSTALSAEVAGVVALGLMVWFGFEARGLRRWSLARRGWRIRAVAEGRRYRDAERRYFTDRLAPHLPPHTHRPVPEAGGAAPWAPAPATRAAPGLIGAAKGERA